ncbi:MAG: hypothetical protein BWY76_00644 [bacterium ADurb.Bin429]|nr:MAG: hypothetical protein BWY76_00644 [bacterium ADurb.Bin429]
MLEFIKIWAFAIFAAILYGILHDQVTIRVCPEYFTVYHMDIGLSGNLTLLALAWGVFATWWMGAILGFPLALAARVGSLPTVKAIQLLKPMGVLLCVMAFSALIAGIAGYYSTNGPVMVEIKGVQVPYLQSEPRFIADLYAHNTSYFIGAWGAVVLCAWVWAMRRRMRIHNET